jgi:hypothetical protein
MLGAVSDTRVKIRGLHVGALVVVLLASMALCWMNRPWFATWLDEATLPAARATYNLNDFAAYVNAARLIADGEGARLYDLDAQRAREARDWGARYDESLAVPYVNPPWFALALLPLAGLPLGAAFLIWLAVCAALTVGAAALLARWARPPPLVGVAFTLAAFGFVPFWRTAILGQTSALALFGLAVGIVYLARGHAGRGGVALALVGVKPQLLLLPLFGLLCGKRARALLACVAASAALLVVGLPVTGPGAAGDYVRLLRSAAYTAYENLPQMQSWRALVEGTLGLKGGPAIVLNLAGMLAALGVVAWAWLPQGDAAGWSWRGALRRGRPAPATFDPYWDLRMALTILMTQLFTPHMHMHDLLIWFAPAGLLLRHLYAPGAAVRLGRRRRMWGFACLWGGYAAVWPAWLLPDARLALIFSFVAAAWLIATLREARQERTPAWARLAITR